MGKDTHLLWLQAVIRQASVSCHQQYVKDSAERCQVAVDVPTVLVRLAPARGPGFFPALASFGPP